MCACVIIIIVIIIHPTIFCGTYPIQNLESIPGDWGHKTGDTLDSVLVHWSTQSLTHTYYRQFRDPNQPKAHVLVLAEETRISGGDPQCTRRTWIRRTQTCNLIHTVEDGFKPPIIANDANVLTTKPMCPIIIIINSSNYYYYHHFHNM